MPITVKHIEPPENLRPFVHRFWEVSTTDTAALRVLPDRSWDFVVHVHGDTYEFEFVGPMTKAIVIPLTPNMRSYGVRFRPDIYFKPLKTRLSDYQNQAVPLAQLVPGTGLQVRKPFLPQLMTFVKVLLEQKALMSDSVVDAALRVLVDAANATSVTEFLHGQPLSARTIERKFHYYVGLSPKQFVRISRQLAVAGELLLRREPNLGRLAADFNYVDQAHMTHDIRLLAGTTPGALHGEYGGFLQYDWPYKAHTTRR